MNREFAAQVGNLARRSVVRTLRQPASAIPPIVFPLALMAVNAAGLDSATQIPNFPTDDFLPFALAVPFIQGALFATMNAGTDLARDIQTGFFNRLSLTPVRGAALLFGTLGGVITLGFAQAVVYVVAGRIAGVHIAAGPAGTVVLLLFATLIALGFGALGATMALRTGSGEAVQGLFPVLFVFLFISSMNMPRDLIEIDWFRIAATLNPVSYLLEGIRSLVIEGWDAQTLGLGFGVAFVLTAVSMTTATLALRSRMERT
jgi:ABC-2 type transport system permease protein